MTSLQPEAVTAVIDSREQLPYSLDPLNSTRGTLQTGDYSIRGLESMVAVERKAVDDLVQCIGTDRERFVRELERLQGFRHKAVVIEGNWQHLVNGEYRSRLKPKSACHSIISWMSKFSIPFAFVGDRQGGQDFVRAFLYLTAKSEWERLQQFQITMDGGEGAA